MLPNDEWTLLKDQTAYLVDMRAGTAERIGVIEDFDHGRSYVTFSGTVHDNAKRVLVRKSNGHKEWYPLGVIRNTTNVLYLGLHIED